MSFRRWIRGGVFASAMFVAGMSSAETEVVVWDGDTVPAGDAVYQLVFLINDFDVALSNDGLAFVTPLFPAPGGGVFRYKDGVITELFRSGSDYAGTPVDEFGAVAIDDAGRVTVQALLGPVNAPTSTIDNALIRFDTGSSATLLRRGDVVPGAGGSVGYFPLNVVGPMPDPAGAIVEAIALEDGSGQLLNRRAVVHVTGPGATPTLLAQDGQTAPNGVGTLDIAYATTNASGQAVLYAEIDGTSTFLDSGIYRADATGLTKIVRVQDAVGGGVVIESLSSSLIVPINDHGQVAFSAGLDVPGVRGFQSGVFIGDGVSLQPLVITGDALDVGTFGAANKYTDLNNAGQVAFTGELIPLDDMWSVDAIFRADTSGVEVLAHEGGQTPAGEVFGNFRHTTFSMNASGQVVFSAVVETGDGQDVDGIFFFDNDELLTIAKVGDGFAGSTYRTLSLKGSGNSGDGHLPHESSSLNDLGQVVFAFNLVDGRTGIALWSPDGLTMPGDTDGDGDIDDADLGTAFSNYTGALASGIGDKTLPDGDTDFDGDVDDADLGTLFAGYTGALAQTPVPEPGGSALCIATIALLIRRRNRPRIGLYRKTI